MSNKSIKSAVISALFLIFTLQNAFSLYFRLDGDRLWLHAFQVPLTEILQEFARTGVEVQLDPKIKTTITASIRGMKLEDALQGLLETQDYLLTWKMLPGPMGRVPKLKSIEIYQAGNASLAVPLPRKSSNFEVTRGVGNRNTLFVKDEILIGVKPGTSYRQFQTLLDEIGGMLVDADARTGIYLIRFPAGTNVEALLPLLSANPLIAHAELNEVIELPVGTSTAATDGISIPAITPPADGSIPVAVLDSGIDPAAGLDSLLNGGLDATDPDRALSDPAGHGTQMAYLASGLLSPDGLDGDLSDLYSVVPVRTFDENGRTSSFAIIQALSYAEQAGAKVINMSWGSETDSDFLQAALQVAANSGTLLVAAAGNEPTGNPVYPAAYSTVIGVAGVTADNEPWSQSNSGSFVALSAPATADFPIGHDGPPGTYAGTSISSAVVSHALTQYLNQNPGSSTAEAWSALQQALSPSPADGYGSGVLDEAALKRYLGTN